MQNKWIAHKWEDVCKRLHHCAEARNSQSLQQQAERFVGQSAPGSYPDFLIRVGEAATLAIADQENRLSTGNQPKPFDPEHGIINVIDEAGMESFPASDPPAYA